MTSEKHGETTFKFFELFDDLSGTVQVTDEEGDSVHVAFADLKAFVEARAWVGVKDRLPAIGQFALAWCVNGDLKGMAEATHRGDGLFEDGEDMRTIRNVTHWRLLPMPPESA